MKRGAIVFLTLLLAVSIASNVSAFGLSGMYWAGRPLVMSPGESKDIVMSVQNGGTTEDVSATVSLTQGGGIASLTDPSATYLVKAGGKTNFNVHIAVPANATIGTEYTLAFMAKAGALGPQGGAVGVVPAVEKSFKVVVGKPEEVERPMFGETTKMVALIVVAVILLAVVIKLLMGKKKRRKK